MRTMFHLLNIDTVAKISTPGAKKKGMYYRTLKDEKISGKFKLGTIHIQIR